MKHEGTVIRVVTTEGIKCKLKWNQLTDGEDLHGDRCAQAPPETNVDFLDWHQGGQTHQRDQQLRHVGVRQVLHNGP